MVIMKNAMDGSTHLSSANGSTATEVPQEKQFVAVESVRSWLKDIFYAGLLSVLIVVFVVQPVKVEGTSMMPRLRDQERIFVNKFLYHLSEVERGDIVVFWYPRNPSKSFIKRVVGLPREKVEIRSGMVLIDSRRLEEPYIDSTYLDHRSYGPERVPDDHYFVLGDRRNSSNDSRHWGSVPQGNIFGKAVFRYWPPLRLGALG